MKFTFTLKLYKFTPNVIYILLYIKVKERKGFGVNIGVNTYCHFMNFLCKFTMPALYLIYHCTSLPESFACNVQLKNEKPQAR